jgi:hypothetical protein
MLLNPTRAQLEQTGDTHAVCRILPNRKNSKSIEDLANEGLNE